ncbi:MAG: hypothetical protein QXW94_06325, partial [Desulfurococcaceae archaeon]
PIAVAISLFLMPYLALYLKEALRLASWLPPGDDYALHVYFALMAARDPLSLLGAGQYPGLVHLLGFASGDPFALGRLYGLYALFLIPAGIALWGLFFNALGAPRRLAFFLSAGAVLGSVRTLAGLIDGQIADKTVLLVVVPLGLYLWARGRPLASIAVLSTSLFINYLGFAYAGLLALFIALRDRRALLFLLALAALGALFFHNKLLTVLGLSSEGWAAGEGSLVLDPLRGVLYAFYGPSGLVLPPLALLLARGSSKSQPLLLTALAVFALGIAAAGVGERLLRVSSLLLPAAVFASLVERRSGLWPAALALHLAGPGAAGWLWLAGDWEGLFAYVERITPEKWDAYLSLLSLLPPNASVGVRWSLDLWFIPLAYAYRPDLNVSLWVCSWGPSGFYVYSPPDPRQWYLPCIASAGPPPGVLVYERNGVGLYKRLE